MSGQMADVIVIDDEEFAVVDPDPGTLFDPLDHGLRPVMTHSANMRGVLARYRITDGALLLSDLQIGHLDQPPDVGGVEPTTDEYGQVWTYLGLDLPVEWSGDLLVGTDLILDLYVHAGYPPVWHYERVMAFDVEAGTVVGSEDRSDEVAAYRDEHGAGDGDDPDNAFERMLKAIKIRFIGEESDDEE